MPISLEKFDSAIEFVAPLVNNQVRYNRKWYKLRADDGWYRFCARGNEIEIIESAAPEQGGYKTLPAYVFENRALFASFDSARRKYGGFEANLALNEHAEWASILVARLEDHLFYPISINYRDALIYEVRQAFEDNQPADGVKGITPELRTLFIYASVRKIKIAEELQKLREEADRREYMNSLPGKLTEAFTSGGANLIDYQMRGNRAEVKWSIEGITFNSVIDTNGFRVVEAGFCVSSEDSRHTVRSLVATARDYIQEDLIHITRY